MSKNQWKALALSLAAAIVSLVILTVVPFLPQKAFAQVTSIDQLSDIKPTDWYFQALKNLVEDYGCVVPYPDGTFRAERFGTRAEFAGSLNACMNQIEAIIASKTSDLLHKDDDTAVIDRLLVEVEKEIQLIEQSRSTK